MNIGWEVHQDCFGCVTNDVFSSKILVPKVGSVLGADSKVAHSPAVGAGNIIEIMVIVLQTWKVILAAAHIGVYHSFICIFRARSSIYEQDMLQLLAQVLWNHRHLIIILPSLGSFQDCQRILEQNSTDRAVRLTLARWMSKPSIIYRLCQVVYGCKIVFRVLHLQR